METFDAEEWERQRIEEREQETARREQQKEEERRRGAVKRVEEYLKTGVSSYIQENSGFLHKGIITFSELESYEKQITKKEEANKMFLRDFRMRMAQMSMMDPTFGHLISNISPEYKAIADEAPAAEKKLEKKANLSGLNKVVHGVSSAERRQARTDVERLKKAREAEYRQKYDTQEKKEEWLKYRLQSQMYGSFTEDLREDKTYCRDVADEALTVSLGQYAPGNSREEAKAHRDSKTIFGSAVEFYFSPAVVNDEKQKKKAMVQGKERIRDVSMIVVATTKDYNWTDVTYKTRDFLAACGKGEFEQLTRRKAMEGVEQDIDSWGAGLAERPALKKVIQGGGDPSIYMDKDLRTELAHIMEECKGALRLTAEIRSGWPFNTIFYDDERARFYAVDYWAQGYMEYLTAVFDHMDKWDLYYRSEAPGGMMSKPVPLPPPARFLSR